ncbi:MAG TPA: xanthine dehydrogenase family protein molybdopterin-binding subunit [Candidatus Sumerlaeota bacterium]|nr:xanthine dehydrogenase family protein molybdopterin-binding subunit [Candidatus Sumerlaeota bacterium]
MTWRPDNRLALENDGSRVDVRDKVTGAARYTTDYYPEGLLWASYIRCPYGKAFLRSSKLEAARAAPGVVEVELEKQEGTYPGDRLGHICAESRQALEQGLAALALEFERDRPATDIEREKKPLETFDEDPSVQEKQPDLERIFSEAAHTLERTYQTQVQTHSCLEPHNSLVDYRGDHAIARQSTQATFSVRNELTEVLGLPPDKVEMHCEHVGGGFGSKFGLSPEGQLAGKLSKKHGRPVRVLMNREEEHLDNGLRPGSLQYMKLAIGPDGKLLGGRIHTWGSVGPVGGGGGTSNPSRYNFGIVAKTHQDVNLNSGFPRAMRAPGHPQGMFAVEMMMDELAEAAGMDPLEFRRLNETSDVRRAMLDVGAEQIGWHRRKPSGTWEGPLKRGFGIGVADWGNSPGEATITIHVYPNGNVEVLSGSQDIGTGFRTLLVDCVAHQLGIDRARVEAKVGVSTYPPGPGSGGSVTSRFVAPKALGAAEQARQDLRQRVAREWGVPADEVAAENGVFKHADRTMSWNEACKLIGQDRLTVTEKENGIFWKEPTGSEAVQFAEVEVDVETGIVRVKKVVALQNVGQAVNRKTVENQITGGVIQGISFALFEDRILNRQTGAMVNPNLEFYKIAGSRDIPEIVPIIWQSRPDAGVNSLGEPPVVPTPGAVGCAVANAIGVPVRRMPITPWRVLSALAERDGGAV